MNLRWIYLSFFGFKAIHLNRFVYIIGEFKHAPLNGYALDNFIISHWGKGVCMPNPRIKIQEYI